MTEKTNYQTNDIKITIKRSSLSTLIWEKFKSCEFNISTLLVRKRSAERRYNNMIFELCSMLKDNRPTRCETQTNACSAKLRQQSL